MYLADADQERRPVAVPQRMTRERLAEAAFWYYVQDLGQEEVARRLGTSRSNVSRLLRAAREQGVIRFEVSYPTSRDLGLEDRLSEGLGDAGVRDVFVASSIGEMDGESSSQPGLLAVAQAGADWLDRNLQDGQTLGLFWGGTVRALVDLAHFGRRIDVHVVQLGGEWSNEPRRSGHDLVRDMAVKLGGRCTYFTAPAFTASPADAQSLLGEPQVAASLALARRADLCVVGVGAFLSGTTRQFLDQARATSDEIEQARERGAVGQIAGRFFDAQGKQIDLAVHRRLVSLDLADLRDAKALVVVASGADKKDAVAAAVRGGLVDVLIVDAQLAAALADDLP
jgi:DNA-binding transcriptional regulator LsrR (DeoR family)